jgi:hypothetical protein
MRRRKRERRGGEVDKERGEDWGERRGVEWRGRGEEKLKKVDSERNLCECKKIYQFETSCYWQLHGT